MNLNRSWIRFPADITEVTIHVDGEPQGAQVDPHGDEVLATVIDESYGGVSIIARDIKGMAIGKHVQVHYGNYDLAAEVRYTKPLDDDRYRIGLQWVDKIAAQ